MIKEALQYLLSIQRDPKTHVVEFDGMNLNINEHGNATEIIKQTFEAKALNLSTLSSIVDFIESKIDRNDFRYILHIESPTEVSLVSECLDQRKREYLLKSSAVLPDIKTGRFFNVDEIIINLKTAFVQTPDQELLIRILGNLTEKDSKTLVDDGISQSVEIKSGITTTEEIIIPTEVELAPYRTFQEVQQPLSPFIFRVERGAQVALFQADGEKWRNEAINDIKNYFNTSLAGYIKLGAIVVIG